MRIVVGVPVSISKKPNWTDSPNDYETILFHTAMERKERHSVSSTGEEMIRANLDEEPFDKTLSLDELLDLLNESRSTEKPLIMFIGCAGIVHARFPEGPWPKYQVCEQSLDILTQTDDYEKAKRIMKLAHQRRPHVEHILAEYIDGVYTGVTQYAPGDPYDK